MPRVAFALACILLSGPALGASGDVLTVLGDRVNVRSGPDTESGVVMQVSRNQRVVEIGRQGDWVHVEITGAGGAIGWIHDSLLESPHRETLTPPPAPDSAAAQAAMAPAAPAGPAAVAAAPGQPSEDLGDASVASPERLETAAVPPPEITALAPGAATDINAVDLQRFRDSVAYLNSRSQSLAGVDLFSAVEPLGGGAVQVGATDAWASIPPAAQRSYATALLERWAAATGRADQVRVQIVDESGQVLIEESKP
jgi:SH3-like domain-containing protein